MNNYYCLVAGLPHLSLDDGKVGYSVQDFKEAIYPYLANEDKKIIDLFFLQYDNKCLLTVLEQGENNVEDKRGNYTQEEILSLISSVKDGEVWNKKYPSYLHTFIVQYLQNKEAENVSPLQWEDTLSALYFQYAMTCKNSFVSSWYAFNLNLTNLLVAFTARKHKLDLSRYIIGDTEISEALRTSTARDFGLSGMLDYYETASRMAELPDLLERERKIEVLKWNWMEDAVFFHYFSIEQIFVFLVKLSMIERWKTLDKQRGQVRFREIIASLKNEVSIPHEFRK